jgi:hypothetical protein
LANCGCAPPPVLLLDMGLRLGQEVR